MTYCTQCGKPLQQADANFCNSCGARLTPASAYAPQQPAYAPPAYTPPAVYACRAADYRTG